jgi:hypothetical protein
MKWITRENVHVDRTACPWLIKRFIDPQAEFIFAQVDKIETIIKKENAIPFDTPNAKLGHHDKKCSFDAFLENYTLKDPILEKLAIIIRAADTDSFDLAPESKGLEAILDGITITTRDDYDAIEKCLNVFDGLYNHIKKNMIQTQFKNDLENMDKIQKRQFIRMHLLGKLEKKK